MISENDDADDIASGGGYAAGDVDEEQDNYEQGDPQIDEGDTLKDEVTPNEACYIDIEPIELNALIPLNDSMAKLRSLNYMEKAKTINNKAFNIWDVQLHQKIKYYVNERNFKDEGFNDIET